MTWILHPSWAMATAHGALTRQGFLAEHCALTKHFHIHLDLSRQHAKRCVKALPKAHRSLSTPAGMDNHHHHMVACRSPAAIIGARVTQQSQQGACAQVPLHRLPAPRWAPVGAGRPQARPHRPGRGHRGAALQVPAQDRPINARSFDFPLVAGRRSSCPCMHGAPGGDGFPGCSVDILGKACLSWPQTSCAVG